MSPARWIQMEPTTSDAAGASVDRDGGKGCAWAVAGVALSVATLPFAAFGLWMLHRGLTDGPGGDPGLAWFLGTMGTLPMLGLVAGVCVRTTYAFIVRWRAGQLRATVQELARLSMGGY